MSRNRRSMVSPWRLYFVLAVLVVGVGLVLARTVQLQVMESDFLQREGRARSLRQIQVPAQRGRILDRHGEPLAVSAPVDSIWAEPRRVLARAGAIAPLSELLDMETAELDRYLRQRQERGFVYLRRHMKPNDAGRVLALRADGVGLQREYHRFYPTGEITGQLLGYTNIDNRGQEGLELAFDSWLSGEPGSKTVIRDGRGRVVGIGDYQRAPTQGRDLRLALDRRIQYLAYRVLKKTVLQHAASSGSATVLDARSGEVLAIVNQPAANPNDRAQLSATTQRNRAIVDLFEPGSTMKPFTVAAALEAGLYRVDTPIDTAPGFLRVGGNVVRDVRDFGQLDVAGVIRKSSNVGISKIALSLPEGALWSLYTRLGVGAPSGVEFPGEPVGQLRHHNDWSRFETATHAFGYGLSVNVLQLAVAYGALANDGVRLTPTLFLTGDSTSGERVLSIRTARAVRRLMEAVVEEGGTAPRARVMGYRVAGKTGTVRKNHRGSYEDDRFVALFAGMAPASSPRLVVVVTVDDPRGEKYYGGQVAAPAFSEIMGGALRLMDVTPDAIADSRTVLAEAGREGFR